LYLYSDYQLIEARANESTQAAKDVSVRILEPGEHVIQTTRLSDRYGKLPAGRYMLRAIYDVPKDAVVAVKHGITPARFEQTLLFLEITAPRLDNQ
jgi:hypothetical protein